MRENMKRLKLLLLLILLPAGLASLFPCDVYMETGPAAAAEKNRIQVKLFVELIHKRCPVNINATVLTATGLAIERQSLWKQVEPGIYQKELVVSLNGKAKGEIRVLRECPKTGIQAETLGIVRL
jgi:hypothetical protein